MRKGRGWTKVTADPICGLMNNSRINSDRDALAERRHAAGAQQGVACALVHADNHFSTSGLAEEEKTSSSSSYDCQEEEALCPLRLAGSGLRVRLSMTSCLVLAPQTKTSLWLTGAGSTELFRSTVFIISSLSVGFTVYLSFIQTFFFYV